MNRPITTTQEFRQHTWPNPLDAGRFRLIFADPPYNIKKNYDADDTGDDLEKADYWAWCGHVVGQLKKLLTEDGTLWWLCRAEDAEFMGCPLATEPYTPPIIWYERFSQYTPTRLTEDYRVLRRYSHTGSQRIPNPDSIRVRSVRQEEGDKRADPRGRVPGLVWQVRRLQGTAKDRVDWHPAQLPPEPLEVIIKGWTNPGDRVLDAFAGSGNLGLACKKLGRNFLGVDQSEKYVGLARNRLTSHDREC